MGTLETIDIRILEQEHAALERNTPFIVLGSLLVATTLLTVLWKQIPDAILLIFGTLVVLHSTARLLFWLYLRRPTPTPDAVTRDMRMHTLMSLASGLIWATSAGFMIQHGHTEHKLLVTFMLAGMVSSSLHSQTAHLPAFHAFFIPCVLGTVGGNLMVGGDLHYAVALTVFAYSALTVRFARTLNEKLTEALRARFEIEDLAARLKVQKDVAEEANLAKSRFLAAASHDVRQPVHAMSLLVGTLQAQALEGPVRRVVDHIADALRALEAMFKALLDISRLDAGVVEAKPEAFDVMRLLTRLLTEVAPQAQAKNLQLRTHCGNAQPVMSDPVLLELILRNLLSNALRYTTTGGVLVGCRRRRDQLEIQVWDTGCGIPKERQHEVFREFVQLTPGTSDRQGLGLGLAIVHRIAALLGHTVTMRSRAGQGSMFSISVPTATSEQLPLRPAASPPDSVSMSLSEHVALVLDDDVEVCDAMKLLLDTWHMQVIAAYDLPTLLERTAEMTQPPSLLICDYGLASAETGLQAIGRIREEFNTDIPAIVITGNTDPERLRETLAAGHPMLHKPVTPADLRASITAALARSMTND